MEKPPAPLTYKSAGLDLQAYEQTLIVALASEDEAAPETLVNYGFNESFKKPFDVALLAERIRTLVEEKRANL